MYLIKQEEEKKRWGTEEVGGHTQNHFDYFEMKIKVRLTHLII